MDDEGSPTILLVAAAEGKSTVETVVETSVSRKQLSAIIDFQIAEKNLDEPQQRNPVFCL
jgi:hypothetical protein